MTNDNYKGWYVLCVKSLHERKIYDLLLESSLEAFLPLVKTIRKWSDRKKIILKPLFPSYIFVNIRSSLEFYKALDLNGAYSYIRFGNEYAKVDKLEIDKIKLLIGNKDVTNVETNTHLPNIGEIKRINYGALNGLECEVLKVNNKNKILIRINSMHLDVTAIIPPSYLTGLSRV